MIEFYHKTVEEIGKRASELRDAVKVEYDQVQRKLATLQKESRQSKSRAQEARQEIEDLQRRAEALAEKLAWLDGLIEQAEKFEDKQRLVELSLRQMAELGFAKEDGQEEEEKGERKKRSKKA